MCNPRRRGASRFLAVLTALASSACNIDIPLSSDFVAWCTLDCGGEPEPPGTIQIAPLRTSLSVGETARFTALLSGPIVDFQSMEWTTLAPAVIRVQPLACSEAAGRQRTCTTDVIAVGPGTADVTFRADRPDGGFGFVYAHATITVAAP